MRIRKDKKINKGSLGEGEAKGIKKKKEKTVKERGGDGGFFVEKGLPLYVLSLKMYERLSRHFSTFRVHPFATLVYMIRLLFNIYKKKT